MEKISNRVSQIRKLKQRSLHDCAKLLGVSKEEYLSFEEGHHSLSLPELELLAFFFEIPPEAFLKESSMDLDRYSILEEDKKPVFTNLRRKIIGAQLALERENLALSFEDLNKKTGLSVETLETYENGHAPVPLDHLFLICDQLDLPVQSLLFQLEAVDEHTEETSEQAAWGPEFPDRDAEGEKQGDDLYQQIIRGMRSIPEKDQAEIAKMILQKMKNL